MPEKLGEMGSEFVTEGEVWRERLARVYWLRGGLRGLVAAMKQSLKVGGDFCFNISLVRIGEDVGWRLVRSRWAGCADPSGRQRRLFGVGGHGKQVLLFSWNGGKVCPENCPPAPVDVLLLESAADAGRQGGLEGLPHEKNCLTMPVSQ